MYTLIALLLVFHYKDFVFVISVLCVQFIYMYMNAMKNYLHF
jgi:hypothetical protein